MNRPHSYHIERPRRNRTPLTLALSTIVAFALGAVVSIWLFNKSIPVAAGPRLSHQITAAATNIAPHLPVSLTSDDGGSERTAVHTARLKAAEAGHVAGAGDKRAAPAERRTSASVSAGGTPAHTHSSIRSEAPTQTQPARLAGTAQPAPESKHGAGGSCTLATSKSKLTLRGKGNAAEIAVSLGARPGLPPSTPQPATGPTSSSSPAHDAAACQPIGSSRWVNGPVPTTSLSARPAAQNASPSPSSSTFHFTSIPRSAIISANACAH